MTALSTPHDVIVVGAGPAGSTLAWRLAKRGLRVLIVEQQTFPRHRVGESLTGSAGMLLRDMGLEPQMRAHGFPVKHGVTVYGPDPRTTFFVPVEARDEHGVPFETPTWQVRRPEFDQLLLDTARAAGATLLQAEARGVLRDGDRVAGLTVRHPDGAAESLPCRFVVDASGFSTFLSKSGVLGARELGSFDKQIAFYAHLDGVRRDEGPEQGNTLLYYRKRLHWSWHIPISNERTSIGIVVPAETFKASGQTPDAFFDDQISALHPELSRRTSGATRATQVWKRANYSYEIPVFAGPGFLAIGDAHRFLDPIFSFGVWVGLKEAELAEEAILRTLSNPGEETAALTEFSAVSNRGQDVISLIINTFWGYPLAFLKLAHFSNKSEIADLLAGRVYDEDIGDVEAVRLMRDLAAHDAKRKQEQALAAN
ncbi:NAD(P)/FAD-dependent oxidoreductase [Primorskyibacter sp. 2E107]|uniref:NAD(P)/FAD-dependent oxidoreductase n=1 Tax=Primorskyibacter sp. 2E107 TaxID=3403458 RepID=UPI003AF524BB